MKYKHLFGPVPSRRLGVSLGIDLVPLKVCSLNCVYCEVGKTTLLTTERKEYVDTTEIYSELNHYLSQKPDLDFITFSGAGEPTLHSKLGEIVQYIKKNYPQYKLALLTNSTLFKDDAVIDEVLDFDLILPSLDCVSERCFLKLNRPAKTLQSNDVVEGLIKLRKKYKGEMWLEVFFVPDLNDNKEEILLLKKEIEKINPDKIQLNTLDRPGTADWVKPLSKEKLEQIKEMFLPLPAEIIAKFHSRKKIKSFDTKIQDQILEAIKRRPCTDSDLTKILSIHINELNKYLSELLDNNIITTSKTQRGVFYKINDDKKTD